MTDATRTDYRSLYEKDYIGAWDLKDKDVTVTITKVKGGELTRPGGKKAKKPVIFMHGTEKGFVINATNGKSIASMYGPDVLTTGYDADGKAVGTPPMVSQLISARRSGWIPSGSEVSCMARTTLPIRLTSKANSWPSRLKTKKS